MKRISKTFRLHPKVVDKLEKKSIKENRSEANVAENALAKDLGVKL